MTARPTVSAHGLMYHDVVADDPRASGRTGSGPDRYKLLWETFLDHLDRIEHLVGAAPALVDDFATRSTVRSWCLTFDDGGASGLRVGEELRRRGWRAHFFVTSGFIGRPGFLDAAAIRELSRMGHEIGSHSATHPERMSALAPDELVREWQESASTLSELLGRDIRTASLPGGYYARKVALAAADAGLAALFTSEPVRTARWVGRCLTIGRFPVLRSTTAGEAGRAAAGETALWVRQYVAWNARKPLKRLGGGQYDLLRRYLLRGNSEAAPL